MASYSGGAVWAFGRAMASVWLLTTLNSGLATGPESRHPGRSPAGTLGAGVRIAPDHSGMGRPGSTVIYAHSVTNLGSIVDTFDLLASSSLGWSVAVTPVELTLSPSQSATILVTLVVSATAQPLDVDVTTVTATSRYDPNVSDSASDTTLVARSLLLPLVTLAADSGLIGSS